MSEKRNVPKLRFPEFSEKWSNSLLGEVVEITSASRVHKDEWSEHGVPFFRSSDVVAAFNGTQNTKAYISLELYKSLSNKIGRVKRDDLLITGGGSIGIPFLIKDDAPLYFKDADLLWIKNTDKTSGQFLYSFFTTPLFRKYLGSTSHIGTIAHYTVVQAKNTPFRFPSLPEQQKIAEFLTSVDKRIELLQAKKEKLEAYKKGVMQKIFAQKLRFKADDGSDFPDWEERKLGEVYEFRTTNSLSRDKLNYESGKFRNIHYGDIHTKFSTLLNLEKVDLPFVNEDVEIRKTFSENLVEDGDLLIADASEDYADIGKTIEVVNVNGQKVLAGLHTLHAKRIESNIEIGFGGFLMKAEPIRSQIIKIAQGTKVLSISVPRMRELNLALPCLEEQRKIVQFLKSLDRSIENLNQQITHTQTWKKGLLQQMFV